MYQEMGGFRILLSSNPVELRAAMPHITIEAEYGDEVVTGSLATFAHHGSRSGNPAPCVDPRAEALGSGLGWLASHSLDPGAAFIIGISHFDLDTLGGLLRVMWIGNGRGSYEFWALAAQADVHGPHTLDRNHPNYDQLAAFWAWSEANRIYAPRDGSVLNITEKVKEALMALRGCIGRDPELIAAGAALLAREDSLNSASYCESSSGVIKRVSGSFTNHMYSTPAGEAMRAVVALNESQDSITISFATPIPGISAKDIVQSLWGPEAGGRDVIAGSPRNRKMDKADLAVAYATVVKAVLGID
jgi:hypothetical protein